MTAIDSAIIKALDKHAEGDTTSIKMSKRSLGARHLIAKDGDIIGLYQSPKLFDVLCLKRKDSDRIDYFICLEAEGGLGVGQWRLFWLNPDGVLNLSYISFVMSPVDQSINSSTELALRYDTTETKDVGLFSVSQLSHDMLHIILRLLFIRADTSNAFGEYLNEITL